jgi:hypothetical protein
MSDATQTIRASIAACYSSAAGLSVESSASAIRGTLAALYNSISNVLTVPNIMRAEQITLSSHLNKEINAAVESVHCLMTELSYLVQVLEARKTFHNTFSENGG